MSSSFSYITNASLIHTVILIYILPEKYEYTLQGEHLRNIEVKTEG